MNLQVLTESDKKSICSHYQKQFASLLRELNESFGRCIKANDHLAVCFLIDYSRMVVERTADLMNMEDGEIEKSWSLH